MQLTATNMHPVTIHAMSHDGRGIGSLDGKTIFIANALLNEKVLCEITRKHSRYLEGRIVEIIESSPNRVTPLCPHFDMCGGCSLQHLSIDEQIRFKEKTLLEQLQHFGQITPDSILPPLSGNPWGYRRKARLGVRFVIKKNKLLVGFREKSGRYLADIASCAILHPAVGTHLTELVETIQTLDGYDAIPQIEVAIGDDDAALIFRHMKPLSDNDLEHLRRFAEEKKFHVYLQPNPPSPVQKLWPLASHDFLTYTLPHENLIFSFHPTDFTQINAELNQSMVEQAMHCLNIESHETVLDLFCGLGNFTLPIAKRAAHVTGIEGSLAMVERAQYNSKQNNLLNTDFSAANLENPPLHAAWMQKKYDKILLDPPRAGALAMMEHMKRFDAKRIVYVSCNPATLARDAHQLVHKHGYTLKAVGLINMFPHTSHSEAMALFVKV